MNAKERKEKHEALMNFLINCAKRKENGADIYGAGGKKLDMCVTDILGCGPHYLVCNGIASLWYNVENGSTHLVHCEVKDFIPVREVKNVTEHLRKALKDG